MPYATDPWRTRLALARMEAAEAPPPPEDEATPPEPDATPPEPDAEVEAPDPPATNRVLREYQ